MIKEVKFDNANDFINYLRPSNLKWAGPLRSWLFRGQRDSVWDLTPSVFRQSTKSWNEVQDAFQNDIYKQSEKEFKLIQRFVKGADDIGLHIPGDSCEFRLKPTNYHKDGLWPRFEVLEIIAIAQHHGIPTRLIDFTYNGLIAAHFALTDAFEEMEITKDNNIDQYTVVWAFAIGYYWSNVNELQRRIQTVSVPSSSNDYLFKQNGAFLYDKNLNVLWNTRGDIKKEEIIKLNKAIEEEIVENKLPNDTIFLQKIMLHKNEVLNALSILYKEGLTHSYLRPNYDWVVKTLKFEDKLGLNRL